ncbi:hypothetical protein P167DRAFT_540135, partial [Morchella conica CCBAS932]
TVLAVWCQLTACIRSAHHRSHQRCGVYSLPAYGQHIIEVLSGAVVYSHPTYGQHIIEVLSGAVVYSLPAYGQHIIEVLSGAVVYSLPAYGQHIIEVISGVESTHSLHTLSLPECYNVS